MLTQREMCFAVNVNVWCTIKGPLGEGLGRDSLYAATTQSQQTTLLWVQICAFFLFYYKRLLIEYTANSDY